jgi:hypothetical protein
MRAGRAPHSRLKHMFDAAESSCDMLFEGLSLHVFADRHSRQSYVVCGTYKLLPHDGKRTYRRNCQARGRAIG